MADLADLLAGFPVIVRQQVVWGEMDAYQHVNNVVYFRYFENVRLEYVRQMNWPEVERQTGIGPILASTSARFRRALAYPDTIAIGARAIDVSSDRFSLEHRIVSEAQQTVVTEGSGLIVAYDYVKKCKAALPEVLKEAIARLEGR